MNTLKCPECGLVNFASAPECKRCHLKFHQSDPAGEASAVGADADPPFADQGSVDANPIATSNFQPAAPAHGEGSPAVLPKYSSAKPKRFTAPMIVFVVYLLLSVAVFVIHFKQFFSLTNSSIWLHLTNPNDMLYIPGFEWTVYASWSFSALEIPASLLLLIPFFCKLRSFLKYVRVYLVFSMIYSIVEVASGLSFRYALTQRLPEDAVTGPMLDRMYWASIFQIIGFLVAFIWLRYFETSNRVKETFVVSLSDQSRQPRPR